MPRIALICLLAALASSVAACAAPAAPASSQPYVGAQVHALWGEETNSRMLRDVGLLADLGATVARTDVAWSSLQSHGPDRYDGYYVKKLDRFVAAAEARGIKVIATLTTTPCWASSAPESLKQGCTGSWWERGVTAYAPADPADYARAARFLTARYRTKLAALEIWNEPNLSYEFKGTGAKPARYAALVRATYPQAKAGDDRVPVLAGATAYSDAVFVGKLYAAGIKGFFDGLSIHPYSDGRHPGSTTAPAKLEFGAGIKYIRQAQLDAGDPKPLWLTEFGYTACNYAACASLTDQANLLKQSVLALPLFPYVRGATIYQLRDMTTDPAAWEENFGMVRQNFQRRPAFAAVRSAFATLRGSGH